MCGTSRWKTFCCRRGQRHGDEGRRDDAQALGSKAGPCHDGEDREQAHDRGCGVQCSSDAERLREGSRDREEVLGTGVVGFHVEHGVELAGRYQYADPGKHPVDDRRRHRSEPTPSPEEPTGDLERTGSQHDGSERPQPPLLDDLEDHDGEAGGGAADEGRRALEEPDQEPPDDARDETERGGHAGGKSNAETERERDQDHDDGRQEIPGDRRPVQQAHRLPQQIQLVARHG